MTQALIGGDFSVYSRLFALPVKIKPRFDLSYVIETEAELRVDFELYRRNLHGHGVTDIFRQIVDITTVDPQHVKVRVLSHIMTRAQRIVDPFEVAFWLSEQPDGWRIYEVESVGGDVNWTLGRTETKAEKSDSVVKGDGDAKA